MFQKVKHIVIRMFRLSRYTDWVFAVLILLSVFLFLAFFFDAWPSTAFLGEVFSSLSGAAIVAIITLLLLDGQAKSENDIQQNTAIFRKKLEIYQEFLNALNIVVVNRNLTDKDKVNLQFQVAYISIHTDSKRLKTISEQVNSIIRKLELDNPINDNIYNELYRLSLEFHNELYCDKWDAGNVDLQSAIQNFSCLGITENNKESYKRLLWLQDSVSLYPIKSRIVGDRYMHVKIGILPEIKSKWQLTSSVMNVVLRLDADFSGSIYLYTDEQTKEGLMEILGNKELWKYEGELECQNALLGVHHVRNVALLCGFKKDSTADKDLKCLYDTLAMMNALWWREGMKITRRKIGSTTNELQVLLSFQKANGTIGTVIDENII